MIFYMQGGGMRRSGATSIDDNAADEKSDKSKWQLLNIHCTSYAKAFSTGAIGIVRPDKGE